MFGVSHTDGSGEDNPPLQRLSDLYDELLNADQEHGDVAVINDDTGWCMSAHRDGRVVLEHIPSKSGQHHMIAVPKERVLELWRQLIDGDIDGLLLQAWKEGYQ